MGASKRYRESGGKEQRPEPRVREFCEFGTASLRGITVLFLNLLSLWKKCTEYEVLGLIFKSLPNMSTTLSKSIIAESL